ncbi:MAG: ATP-binding protein [Solirubrobacterales bacterium]
MSGFPLRYARRNVLIGTGGEAAALYRAEPVSYPFLPTSEKWALLHRLERFGHLVGADFSLWRVQRSYPAERYAAELAGAADERHADPEGWRHYLAGHQERLAELDSHLPEIYVAVALQEPAMGHLRTLDRARRRVEEIAGVGGPRPISGAELEALASAEERCFQRLGAVVGLRRATTTELQWLLRRGGCRGVAEPVLEDAWQPDALVLEGEGSPSYEPLEHDLWRLANAPMSEDPAEPPSLEVEAEEGRSFQAILCAGSLAEEAEFPGPAELLFAPLEDAGFPVDAVLHARWIGNREALGQVRKRILDVEHAYREQAEGAHAGPGWQAEDDRELAREYEAILASSAHPPMLRAYLSLAVGAPDRTELERRVEVLRERFGEVRLHRPRGLQHRLFFDHMPRTDSGSLPDYRQQMTVEQLGAMVPLASSQLGSPRGIYIGHTPQGRPVLYDPTEAPRTARPSGVLLAGTLGSGKTLAAQTIAYGAQRGGSLVVDFDPKPDHGLDRVPELQGEVEVLELSGDPRHRGKLDPLRIGLPELREELASSYLLELLRDPPPAWENAIDRAVRDAVRSGQRSLMCVVERLCGSDSEAAREAAEALEVVSDFGLARLGFAPVEAGHPAPSEPTATPETASSVITIRTPGLVLPDAGTSRETFTRAERVAVATLSLVAAQALRLVSGNRRRHKIVLLDEAWFFLSSVQGRALLNRIIRLARALNATVLVATQLLGDLGALAELFGVYLLCGQETLTQARAGLDQIGLGSEEALAQRLTEYRAGQCLMRDLGGRVGEVQFDLVFGELLAALDNTPGAGA